MAIDANGDGEISLQEALNVYQLKVGIKDVYSEAYPASSAQTEVGYSDLTHFTNLRVLKYSGTLDSSAPYWVDRFLDATGFTNLEELYYLGVDSHSLYK